MTLVILTIFAVGGTAAVVYFAMDGSRREAQRRLARLREDRAELRDEADSLEQEAKRLKRFQADLASAVERHREAEGAARARAAQQEAALATAQAAFEQRVIRYDELAAENRLLKTDLKNTAVELARLDYVAAAAGSALEELARKRDQLGRDLFEAVRSASLKAVSPSNYPALKRRLQATAERVRAAGGDLPESETAAALAELHTQYERAVRAAAERGHQAELRERMREEIRREREAQEAIEQAERERAAVAAALGRALTDAAGRHAAEVDQLRAQLAEAEAKAARAISNAQLTKRGTVYVISNRGSFGPNVFKIGMTRRDNYMDRVRELGDASVPFPFDVHLTAVCEDAPKLEAALHRRFHTRRVNKLNLRKEFFHVSIEEVVEAVRLEHGEVEYTADAAALEFEQSRVMTDAELAEVEQVFAAADAAVGVTPGEEPEE